MTHAWETRRDGVRSAQVPTCRDLCPCPGCASGETVEAAPLVGRARPGLTRKEVR